MLKVLWRTLLLLLASTLLLGAMAAYVKLTQHRPDPQAPLEAEVTADIIWPWQETELRLHYSGEEGVEVISPPPKPADLVFLLDTSGSMSDEDLTEAKAELLKFPRDLDQSNRLAVVTFSNQADPVVPLARDYARIRDTLATIPRSCCGGTSFLAGLREALRLLQGQPQATVVMLTDSEAGESLEELRRFYEQEWRPSGHELFMVGIGTGGVDPASFQELTDDPAHYIIRGMDRSAIGEMFAEVRERMGNVLGRNGELRLPLAEPLWERQQRAAEPDQTIQSLSEQRRTSDVYALGTLFQRPYEWNLPLAPAIGGILTTLADPVILSYRGADNERREVQTRGSAPKVLAITPWLLFWLLLPALLYLLAALLEWLLRPTVEPVELSPIESVRSYRPPPNLPLRFPADAQRIRWMPSLVLGLGGAGRHVLTHIRQILDDSLDESATRPVLLALDVARDEVAGPNAERVPGCLSPLNQEQVFLLPPESCLLQEAIHQRRQPQDPAAALDLGPYRQLSADSLSLNKGTNGQAALARLALLNDFAKGVDSALLQRLQTALAAWRSLDPDRRQRQIILIANVHGGVGSGWLSDLLVLLRRLVKTDEARGHAIEISVLLLGAEAPQREKAVSLQAPTLFAELDRLASAGLQPFRHCLSLNAGGTREFLDGLVDRRPQDAVFFLPGGKRDTWKAQLYPAAADAVALFLEQRRRVEFMQVLQSLQAVENQRRATEGREFYTQVAVHNAVFPRSFFRALLADRLLCVLAGGQILFPDLEIGDGQPRLRKRTLDPAVLLTPRPNGDEDQQPTPNGVDQSILAALREAALGDKTTLQALEPDADSLRQAVQRLRLLLLDNANRLLSEERHLGLSDLLQAVRGFSRQLQGLEQEPVRELADTCNVLASQAAAWIERFWGTSVLRELDTQLAAAADAGQSGFVAERTRNWEYTLRALWEWQQSGSRVLAGPLADTNLQDPEACRRRLDEQLYDEFLQVWLNTTDALVERLAARCYWEVVMPGLDGKSIGISLVFRGTIARRYVPVELERFGADVLQEVTTVLDSEGGFHILRLLQRRLNARDTPSLVRFIESLKGGLRGERSSLLLALPVVPGAYGPELQALRDALQRTFERDTAGAAELVYTCTDNDRYRIALMQLLPLLTTVPQAAPLQPLH